MYVAAHKNLRPQLWLATFDKVTRLLFKHRVVVSDGDEFLIAEAFGVCNVCQVRVTGFAELSNNQRLV